MWEYGGSGSWTSINSALLTNVDNEVNCVNADNVVLDLTKTEDDLITFDLKIKSNSY